VLAYLGRYGYQDMTRMEHEPTVKLRKWAARIDQFIDEERQQMESTRNR
jgi:hypothetical protein